MELEFLLKSFGFLIVILGVLLYFLLMNAKKKKEKIEKKKESVDYPSFQSLVDRVKNNRTSKEQLLKTVEDILKYYGRVDTNLEVYGLVMLRLCKHPHTDKNIILKYDKELRAKNPEYNLEINEFLMQGLNSRDS